MQYQIRPFSSYFCSSIIEAHGTLACTLLSLRPKDARLRTARSRNLDWGKSDQSKEANITRRMQLLSLGLVIHVSRDRVSP